MFNKLKYNLVFFLLLIISTQAYALMCSDYGDFKEFGGHYYTVTTKRIEFGTAKQLAESNNGYLAIPNSQQENSFITSLVKGGQYAWIGIYDPNYTSNYCYGTTCVYDDSRFKTIKNGSLTYKNWATQQPNNLVKDYDIVDGVEKVSPLGEHWVAIGSPSGQWADFGNHNDEHNNPVRYYAVYEFDTMPECYTPPSNITDQIAGVKCNTKIYDNTISELTVGNTYDCQQDKYGTDFCPSALADCAQEWDYQDGYSTSNTSTVIDYTSKDSSISYINPTVTVKCSTGAYDAATGKCIYNGIYQIVLNRQPDPSGFNHWKTFFSSPPTYANIKQFVDAAVGNNEPYMCGYDSRMRDAKGKQITAAYVWYLGRCPESSGFNYWYANATFDINTFMNSAKPECNARGHCPYTPPLVYTSNPYTVNECPSGYSYNTSLNKCESSVSSCPSGYIDNGSNCKKTITYSYYNYLCDAGYTVINSGGSCSKTDPNTSTNNSSTLDDPCNGSTPPANNCKKEAWKCQEAPDRKCAWVDNKWQCSPFPCLTGNDFENTDTEVGLTDANNDGWQNNGDCVGQLYIFNGKDNRCRSDDILFGLTGGGCCDKDKVFLGLVACKDEEMKLAKLNKQDRCHYIGEYCSKKINLGFTKICVQHKKTYCCFNSKLARIINEQGRVQINKDWGAAKTPNCKGFTPEEFQKLDFSKIDMSEFFGEIQQNFNVNFMQNQQNFIQDRITNNMDNISGN